MPGATAHLLAKVAHFGQHPVDIGHHIHPVNQDRAIAAVAQGDVEDGAIFGVVDLLAIECRLNRPSQIGLVRQRQEQRHCLRRDPIFGIVKEDVIEVEGKARKALRILAKEHTHRHALHLLAMGLQRLPGGRGDKLGHAVSFLCR